MRNADPSYLAGRHDRSEITRCTYAYNFDQVARFEWNCRRRRHCDINATGGVVDKERYPAGIKVGIVVRDHAVQMYRVTTR
jgi:hypothetical protein